MPQVAIIGAGQTGGTMGQLIAERCLADVVLFDVNEGAAKGKALDLAQAGAVTGTDVAIWGTSKLEETKGSDVIIVTAGSPRKEGQSREDLAAATAGIIKSLVPDLCRYSPEAIFIGFTNPMDAMTQVIAEEAFWRFVRPVGERSPYGRIIGQGGMLDSARFRTFIAREAEVSVRDVHAYVLGAHTEKNMVPVVSTATVSGVPLANVLSGEAIERIVTRTKNGGAEILGLMKTGSAFFAPAQATVAMVESILLDRKRVLPVSAYLDGEYGVTGVYVGVLAVLGRDGVEKIFEMPLDDKELKAFREAAESIRSLVTLVKSKS